MCHALSAEISVGLTMRCVQCNHCQQALLYISDIHKQTGCLTCMSCVLGQRLYLFVTNAQALCQSRSSSFCCSLQDAAFDPAGSSTSVEIFCGDPRCLCGSPACSCAAQGQCSYVRNYGEHLLAKVSASDTTCCMSAQCT